MPRARLSDSATVVASADLLSTEFGEETVILNLADGQYYGLENVGARIWSLVRNETTIRQLRDALVAEYDVPPERCARDLQSILQQLRGRGLIRISEPA